MSEPGFDTLIAGASVARGQEFLVIGDKMFPAEPESAVGISLEDHRFGDIAKVDFYASEKIDHAVAVQKARLNTQESQ